MKITSADMKRASDDNQKMIRRQSILDAAKKLFANSNGKLPTVSVIAKSCFLAKGTVYLYFSTKEEIFLTLIKEEYEAFFLHAKEMISNLDKVEKPIQCLAESIRSYLEGNPYFLQLASISNNIIEQNIEAELALDYKKFILDQLLIVGNIVEGFFQLPKGEGAKLLWRMFALIIGIWQLCNPSEELKELYIDNNIQSLAPNFHDEIIPSLINLVSGSINNK